MSGDVCVSKTDNYSRPETLLATSINFACGGSCGVSV